MPSASYVSKYRTLATFVSSTGLTDLDNTGRWDTSRVSALAISAEEYLLGYGEPFIWLDREKNAFDAAVRAIMLREVAAPSTAFDVKLGEHQLEFTEIDKLPQVINWAKVVANPERGLSKSPMTRC